MARRNRKGKKKVVIITVIAVILVIGVIMVMRIMNSSNNDISPLTRAGDQRQTGRRLEVSFSYDKVRMIATSQFAFWIEDMNGNYIHTLYATNYTAQGGYRRRPQSISQWVSAANPAGMHPSEIDTISGATPAPGDYIVYWNFSDRNGNLVADTQYRFFIDATMNFDDNAMYSGIITIGDEAWTYSPLLEYTVQNSRYKNMITNVRLAYYSN